MENHILHICQGANCVEEKLWPILAPNIHHGIILVEPINNRNHRCGVDVRPILIIPFIIPILQHQLVKPPLCVGYPHCHRCLGVLTPVAPFEHIAKSLLYSSKPLCV
ncbi:Os03g0413250 [Oryza sativa Japonica Group]|uniref:Os03g0413250 protein n=1 Tax=Oryza sativa subsp. japonica TaxID=39947 RepID=A0A0P0VZI0_ORYSJ|nr:hypothetical protein EE612_018093 [Oryza sativa]BAS84680.1 Os03g0413250 [Oryza sativa Japonica Group]